MLHFPNETFKNDAVLYVISHASIIVPASVSQSVRCIISRLEVDWTLLHDFSMKKFKIENSCNKDQSTAQQDMIHLSD